MAGLTNKLTASPLLFALQSRASGTRALKHLLSHATACTRQQRSSDEQANSQWILPDRRINNRWML